MIDWFRKINLISDAAKLKKRIYHSSFLNKHEEYKC